MNAARRLAFAAIVAAVVVSACEVSIVPDDEGARNLTARLKEVFPLIEELQVGSYLIDEDCQYIGYGRGSFSTDLSALQCWVVTYPDPVAMDEQADQDFERVSEAFGSAGLDVAYVAVDFDADGRVRANSFFDVGPCSYVYEPAWAALPSADGDEYDEDAEISAIDSDWWRVC